MLISSDCGTCASGQFLCPDRQVELSELSQFKTCINSAEDYIRCPGLKGTHFDWDLSIEDRLDYLIAHTSLEQRLSQVRVHWIS